MKVHLVMDKERRNIYGCFKKGKKAKAYIGHTTNMLIIKLKVQK